MKQQYSTTIYMSNEEQWKETITKTISKHTNKDRHTKNSDNREPHITETISPTFEGLHRYTKKDKEENNNASAWYAEATNI
jgi:hypothetical protein